MSQKKTKKFTLYAYNDVDSLKHSFAASRERKRYNLLLQQLIYELKLNSHVTLLDHNNQINRLSKRITTDSFDVVLGLGESGYNTAKMLHAQTNKFSEIHLIPITRKEVNQSKYIISYEEKVSLNKIISKNCSSIAIVDDTLYSGITLLAVLKKIRKKFHKNVHILCLQAIEETIPRISAHCSFTTGFLMPGKIEEEVSVIKISGLFMKGAIKRVNAPPLAFFERPEWIANWFPNKPEKIIEICRNISELLSQNEETNNDTYYLSSL